MIVHSRIWFFPWWKEAFEIFLTQVEWTFPPTIYRWWSCLSWVLVLMWSKDDRSEFRKHLVSVSQSNICLSSTCQQFSQPIFCSSAFAIKVDLAAKSTWLGWSRSTVLHLGWGIWSESPARVMLTPSLVQPSHPLELNTIMVNKVDPSFAWQLWVSRLQISRPTGHLGISFESELYLQP